MSMERFVKRHTRIILTILVVMFSIPLVLSFGPWSVDGGAPEDLVLGTTNQGEEILKSEWAQARDWAAALHAFSNRHYVEDDVIFTKAEGISIRQVNNALFYFQLAEQNPQFRLYAYQEGGFRSPEQLIALQRKFRESSAEHHDETAWSLAVGLRRAAALGIVTTDAEIDTWVHSDDRPWSQGEGGFKQADYDSTIKAYGMSENAFRDFARAMLTYEKYMSLMTDHAQKPLKEIEVGAGGKHGRVWYALFNPDELSAPVAVSDADVQKYYDDNAPRFASKPRIAFDYLFLKFDAYDSRVPAPTEAEMESYYLKNVDRFKEMPPHEHGEEDHEEPQERTQTYEEVKDEVRKLLIRPKSERMAREAMAQVWMQLDTILGGGDPNQRAERGKNLDLNGLATSLRARGLPVEYGLTAMIADTLDDVKPVEDKIGRSADPRDDWSTFLFDPTLEIGSIGSEIEETDQGLLMVRLTQKAASQPLPLDDAQIRKIRSTLERDKRAERVKETVDAFAKRLEKESFASALAWVRGEGFKPDVGESGYFHEGDAPAVDPELGRWLGRMSADLLRAAGTPEAKRTAVQTIRILNDPRILCVYLEDVVELPPGDVEARLEQERANAREQARAEARLALQDKLRKSLVVKNRP